MDSGLTPVAIVPVPCGDCFACCSAESGFHGKTDCEHLDRTRPGTACLVYAARPDNCREFDCRRYVQRGSVTEGVLFDAAVPCMEGASAIIWKYIQDRDRRIANAFK